VFPPGVDVDAVARQAEASAGYSLRNCSIAARDLPANTIEHASTPNCAALVPLERRHKPRPAKAEVASKARLDETPLDAPLRQPAKVTTFFHTAKLLRKRTEAPRAHARPERTGRLAADGMTLITLLLTQGLSFGNP
jgi:hypothetical protein